MLSFALTHWTEIQTNLVATAIAFPIEVLITLLIVNKMINYREDKRWRPARKNVAQSLFELHRVLFNAAHHVVDPAFHVDKKGHGIPPNMPQNAANYWGKSIFLQPLDLALEKFKKTIEYNNAALDSSILPMVSDFLIAAEQLADNVKFMIRAYDPQNASPIACFHPVDTLRAMESVYKQITKLFPEIGLNIGNGPVTVLTAEELSKIYDQAAKDNPRIEFLPR